MKTVLKQEKKVLWNNLHERVLVMKIILAGEHSAQQKKRLKKIRKTILRMVK